MPAIYVILKRFSQRYLGISTEKSNTSLWSWRTVNSKSQRHGTLNPSVSELELVPMDATVATINTRVSNQHEDEYSKQHRKHGEGIMVSKTVRRAEDII
jgi:hypothetical protein